MAAGFERMKNFGKAFLGNYWVQRGFRVTRVGAIVFTVYSTGYRAGISDYVADPEQMRLNLLSNVIVQAGASSILEESDPLVKRLKRIGPRIVHAAQGYCEEQVTASEIDPNSTKEEWEEKWTVARKRMSGDWSFIVIDSDIPNAFVSNIFPQMVFVHKGLFTEIKPTDEELALIVAHEISHLIHDHSQNHSYINLILAVIQLFGMVFVDPTGTWFYVFDIGAARLSKYISASYSRDTETEADITGVQIAARACFETREAGKVFLKFAEFKGHDGTASSWMDTHPADANREAYLREASELHNPETYNPSCKQVESYLDQFHKYMSKKQEEKVRDKVSKPKIEVAK
jgi:Zn-dependent protease with chaperone function